MLRLTSPFGEGDGRFVHIPDGTVLKRRPRLYTVKSFFQMGLAEILSYVYRL